MDRQFYSPMDFELDNPRTIAPDSPFASPDVVMSESSRKRPHQTEDTSSNDAFSFKSTVEKLPDIESIPKLTTPNTPISNSTPNLVLNPVSKSASLNRQNGQRQQSNQELDGTDRKMSDPNWRPQLTDRSRWSLPRFTFSLRNRGLDCSRFSEKLRRNRTAQDSNSNGRVIDKSLDLDDEQDSSSWQQSTRGGQRLFGGFTSTAKKSDMLYDLPYVASSYLQLGFNVFILGLLLYLIVIVLQTLRRDVDKKIEEYSAIILQEIAVCSKNYFENRCDPAQRVPAMEKACNSWEQCMNRDPAVVGRAKVSAETFAEILNSFIEPFSYKSMVRSHIYQIPCLQKLRNERAK